jgi:peptidoglycan/xylan/chitin deacetylase (PgdA/CDA1 family)
MVRLPGAGAPRRAARWLRNRLKPAALILAYHRVAELPIDPWHLAVTPDHFAEHLQVLRKHARPMTLHDLHRALAGGSVPRRAAVITFDDGYADNLLAALPLLERFDVPATFFVASGYLGADRDFWWDEVERLLLEPGPLPQQLQIRIDQQQHEWSLDEVIADDPAARQQSPGWSMRSSRDPAPRQLVYRELHSSLKPLTDGARQPLMEHLRAWAGLPSLRRASHRVMTPHEVATLAASPLAQVEAHSRTHPLLPALSAAEQLDEIRGNKADLEAIVGRAVAHFAYPFGPYTAETVDLVRKAGFSTACAAFHRPLRRPSAPFELPRLKVDDWDGETFAGWLKRWFVS